MCLRFLIHRFDFFDLLERQVGHAVDAACLFREITAQDQVTDDRFNRMTHIEHQGDDAAHTIIHQLNRTFLTPFDRQDVHTLVMELDDITDMIHNLVRRLRVYDITGVDPSLVEFAALIEPSVRAVARAIGGLRHAQNARAILDACVEVHRLENVGDVLRDQALAELFATARDPILVIKWKDIYQDAETVLDVCEDVVHVIASILVKQA